MKHYAIFARMFAGVMLIIIWGLTDSPLIGVVLVLILLGLSAVRYRIKPFKRLNLTEAAVCVLFSFFWFPALTGLFLPLIGLLEDKWSEWEQELLKRDFEDRAERIKLEKEREAAALQLRRTKHAAEINERNRIAQDIHDHVGHEVTGALIALQTALKLYESNDKRAGELLAQTVKRLESASENLRDTVHNLKPVQKSENELENLCEAFRFCEINYSASGDITNRELLAANLKEALTNIARHSDATLVNVQINANADYVRMTISDNGSKIKNLRFGLGLSGMRERVRAVNGTLTVNTDNGFQIVCIIPKGDKA